MKVFRRQRGAGWVGRSMDVFYVYSRENIFSRYLLRLQRNVKPLTQDEKALDDLSTVRSEQSIKHAFSKCMLGVRLFCG